MSESHEQSSLTGAVNPLINLPNLLEASIASVADLVYTFDLDGRVLYANPSLLTLWGKTLDEAVGKNFHELGYAPELAARLQAQIQEVVQTSRLIKDETLYTDSNGQVECYEYLFTPVISNRRLIAVSGTMRVITERKKREAELIRLKNQNEAQAHLFDATLSSINDLAYTFDLEGNWTYANKPLLALWGKPLHEIVGKSSLQLGYPPELAERLKQQVKTVVETRKPFKGETFFTSADGIVDYHEYIFSPVFAPDGSVVAVCGTTRLITERKRAEENLRKRSERMQLLSETLSQLLSAPEAETVVQELFPKVASHLKVDIYFNFMVDKEDGALRLHSCAGIDAETAKTFSRLKFGDAICGTVAQTRKPIVANDLLHSTDKKAAILKKQGIQTYVCYPLIAGERLLGTLSFASRTRQSFDDDELEFIEIISQHAAIALDRMQTTRTLRHSEAQVSVIINKSPVGIYLVDAELRLRQVNPKAQPVFGKISKLIGSSLPELLRILWSPATADELIGRFQHTLQTGESYYQTGFSEDRADYVEREFYDWEIHRITLPDGRYGVVCYFVDVSAHMLAQLKIQEGAERLRLALLAAAQGDWAWDAATDLLSLSPRAAEIYGVNPEAKLTRTEMRKLLVEEDQKRAQSALSKAVETHGDYDLEYRVRGSGNKIRWVAAKGRVTYQPDGKLKGMLGVVQDITEQKNNEAALRESNEQLESRVKERTQKLQETIGELESFSYSISHDLRAPLRAMQSFAIILEQECGERVGEAGKDYLRRITGSAERMDRLIQDILVFSRVSRSDLKLQPVNLSNLVHSILESYPNFEAAKVGIHVEDPLPNVLANEAALTQCISNLLGNAIKFIAADKRPCVRLWATGTSNGVRLFVQDNGIGIEKESHERIFGIFQQLNKKIEGTGIGLAIVKKAAERMGGSVGLESTPGQGSTFWLDLKSPLPPHEK